MLQSTNKVMLNLKINEEIAREVAEAVYMRANPHDSQLVDSKFTNITGPDGKDDPEIEINVDNLKRYFVELTKAVAEFWNNTWDATYSTVLKPHELRQMYLPLMYGVILSSVGNCKVGNYQYVIMAKADEKPDKDFLLKFSARLESLRMYIRGDLGQIGNRSAQVQVPVMCCLLGEVDTGSKSAEMYIRDGMSVDTALAGLSTLVGLSLVNEAYSILYTGVDEVNFRQLTDTLVEKGLMEFRKGN